MIKSNMIIPENIKRIVSNYGCTALILILICCYIFSLHIVPVNADYGYYVGAAKSIASGLVPYRDISIGYPPFVFYLLSFPYALCGTDISPLIPMYIAFLFNVANGYLIWLILRYNKVNRAIRQFVLLIYILYLFSLESIFLGLEPFATFWGLLGTYVLLSNKKYLGVAGLCLTLAFLCKQYAILYAPIYALLILLLKSDRTIKARLLAIWQVALWSLISILIIHIFLVYITGKIDYFTLLLGTGYGRRSFLGLLEVFQKRFFHIFFIVVFIPITWQKIDYMKKRIMIFLITSIFLLLLQNYYDTSPHYLIFIIPFIVILIAIVIQNILSTLIRVSLYGLILFFAIFFSAKAIGDYQITRKNSENCRELTRKQQFEIIRFLREVIPPNSKTVVARQWNYLVTPHLYGLVDIAPINYANTRFGFEDDSLLIEQTKDAEILIIENSHPLYLEFLQQLKPFNQCFKYKDVCVFTNN